MNRQQLPILVHQLTEILTQQSERMERLANAVRDQRQAFVSWQATEVDTALDSLADQVEPLESLESQRAELVDRLCRAVGLPSHSRMRDIARALGSHCTDDLVMAVDRAREAAAKTRMENAVGAGLLEFAARAQSGLWSNLTEGAPVPDGTYGPGGGRSATAAPGTFIDGRI